ncbi:MAG: hypothetical protein JKX80_01150 [Candidatus Pacebacteria bacterium]|nr:hypothetical protein [Candidatus Paceibacterota bacterium]
MDKNFQGEQILKAFSKQLVRYKNPENILIATRSFVLGFYEALPKEKKIQPHSIIASRFTLAGEALLKGFVSCGAMVNICTFVLRELGFEVQLVHGESAESVDHAWLLVTDKNNKACEYDPTRPRLDVPETHTVKKIVSSWEDIRLDIEKDHKTLEFRQASKSS